MTANTTKSLRDTGCLNPSGIHAMRNGTCTRCGAVETVEVTPSVEQTAKFEQILDAEFIAQDSKLSQGVRLAGTPTFVINNSAAGAASDAKKFWDLFNALTMDEMRAYGEYRKAQLAADAAWRAANA